MLLEAFAAELVDEIGDESLVAAYRAEIAAWLAGEGEGMNEHVAAPLDVAKIREDFPILELKPYGKTLVYLDNAASAQKPRQVVDRMVHATYNEYSNVHRGLHYLANAATEAYEAARESVRAFLNAGSIDEIIFTKSATEAINLVACLVRPALHQRGRRDRPLDHGASRQYRALAFPARAQGRGAEMGRCR